ncbi:hypothetical protein L917_19082 [Phytophthora nicotianae]|uniref:ZSWIM1/3 RNaseH-like domain-containing protein n=1 Tax=Phytophthora nicotianae TaxID=4792 RepID=W2K5I1_PHYNI|nr:hypothetical protein L917_19082 [Phytophthora nicotianae]
MSMSSRHQREMITRFPELLSVDCTHKTNRYNYQLSTLMAIDDKGRGQPVQHSLLERNADWRMSRALDDLFRMDPDIGEKVQYLRTASRKPEYDKLSSDDHDAINTLVHNMLYAMSEEIYDTNWASMKTQNWVHLILRVYE